MGSAKNLRVLDNLIFAFNGRFELIVFKLGKDNYHVYRRKNKKGTQPIWLAPGGPCERLLRCTVTGPGKGSTLIKCR